MCMSCGNHNFASRATCNKCNSPKQAGGGCGFGMMMAPAGAAAPKSAGRDVRMGDWMCPQCGNHNFASKEACNKCGAPKTEAAVQGAAAQAARNMRVGDWMCPGCGNHNYASKDACSKCGTLKTEAAVQGTSAMAMRPGDWMCPACGNHNYASKEVCNKCGAAATEDRMGGAYGAAAGAAKKGMSPYGAAQKEMKEGDWSCPGCSNHNYSSRVECNKCGAVKEGFRKGDWICKSCKNHNYANKMQCNKCNAPRNDGVMMGGMQGGMMMMPQMMGNGAFGGCGMGAQMAQMNQMAGGKGGCMGGAGASAAWACTQCGNQNFAIRMACNRCGAPKPQPVVGLQQMPGQVQMPQQGFAAAGGRTVRVGDWMCPSCGNHNFASKEACNKCGVPKTEAAVQGAGAIQGAGAMAMNGSPGFAAAGGQNMRPGDWSCRACNNHNFASRGNCNKCGASKEADQ